MGIPGGDSVQLRVVVEKDGRGNIKKKNWGSVRFVPLRGEYGFKSVRY